MIISLPIEDRQREAAADALAARAVAAGAVQVTPPTRKPWTYMATFTDPDGHLWMVTAP
ncbi:hypothetical protein EV651_11389 [Kribbella sp. VKM Ac-2571]|uniref:VOC family protein n=1 Tax=Kribbella sp. VKM Ac-2571 TaxID=2512222 RepID=UPI0010EF8951|nr:VOC family protein [Kribbella sp. VKM Ac-2571]TDO56064.1 hypothetical protein EV651_11389 [Kribbella sp. VKM Ac-2571]